MTVTLDGCQENISQEDKATVTFLRLLSRRGYVK